MTVKPGWARKQDRLRRRELGAAPTNPERAQVPGPRPLWKLDRSEQRVLFVTFVGGVASILAAAFLVGMAISLGRILASAKPHTTAGTEVTWFCFITAIMAVLVWVEATLRHKVNRKPRLSGFRRFFESADWVIMSVLILWLSVMVLTLIGLAAGIH